MNNPETTPAQKPVYRPTLQSVEYNSRDGNYYIVSRRHETVTSVNGTVHSNMVLNNGSPIIGYERLTNLEEVHEFLQKSGRWRISLTLLQRDD